MKEEGKDMSPSRDANDNKADWDFAHSELLEREGVDLKVEMEQKMKEMEELWRKEKEQADQAFQQERKKYEDQIETLQKQVAQETHSSESQSKTRLKLGDGAEHDHVDDLVHLWRRRRLPTGGRSIRWDRAPYAANLKPAHFFSVNPIFEAECSWSERQYELAAWALAKWRVHQFTSLRDDLWGNAVFLKVFLLPCLTV